MAKQKEKKNLLFGAISKLLHRKSGEQAPAPVQTREAPILHRTPRPEHPRRTEPDIPFERLEGAYMPTQTSLKASFRADGADRQRDQEFANGYADERWNDEDRFTNKSGDPRIGTHGRTYEPGERRRR